MSSQETVSRNMVFCYFYDHFKVERSRWYYVSSFGMVFKGEKRNITTTLLFLYALMEKRLFILLIIHFNLKSIYNKIRYGKKK